MKKRLLWISWLLAYGVCAGLSHITRPEGNQLWTIPLFGALFFVPPVLLLIDAMRKNEEKLLRTLRWLSGLSVGLTVVAFLVNLLSVFGGETLGIVLNEVLIFVSVPLFCFGNLYASTFCWCCIFFTTLLRKNPRK